MGPFRLQENANASFAYAVVRWRSDRRGVLRRVLLLVLRPTLVKLPALHALSLVLECPHVLLKLESSRMFLNPRLDRVLYLLRLPKLAMFSNALGIPLLALVHANLIAYE